MAKFAYAVLSLALLVCYSFALVEPNKSLDQNVHGEKTEAELLARKAARKWSQITRVPAPKIRATAEEGTCAIGKDCTDTFQCPEPCTCEPDDVGGGFYCEPRNRDCIIGEQCYGNGSCDGGCVCDPDDIVGEFNCFPQQLLITSPD